MNLGAHDCGQRGHQNVSRIHVRRFAGSEIWGEFDGVPFGELPKSVWIGNQKPSNVDRTYCHSLTIIIIELAFLTADGKRKPIPSKMMTCFAFKKKKVQISTLMYAKGQ